MSDNSLDWERLGIEVRERRGHQRLSQSDVAARGGPSEITIRRIERGEVRALRNKTKEQLERALGWSDGAVDRVLNGAHAEEELDWDRLAIEVRKRRIAKRLPLDMSSSGGPSEMTTRKVEAGEPTVLRPQTKVRLETALAWREGTVDRILNGTVAQEDLVAGDGTSAAPLASVMNDPRALRHACEMLAEAVLVLNKRIESLEFRVVILESQREGGGAP